MMHARRKRPRPPTRPPLLGQRRLFDDFALVFSSSIA